MSPASPVTGVPARTPTPPPGIQVRLGTTGTPTIMFMLLLGGVTAVISAFLDSTTERTSTSSSR
jgi:hypothetical protein